MKNWKEEYRKELIQVAAVAMAAIQDMDTGSTEPDNIIFTSISHEVFRERIHQFSKFDNQHHEPFVWNTILTEEVGEVCQASLEWHFGR